MNSYEKIYTLLTEKRKYPKPRYQRKADKAEDEALAKAQRQTKTPHGGASSSNPKSKRYAPGTHTMHSDKDAIMRRLAAVFAKTHSRKATPGGVTTT
tara:strand:- start:19 stop:309 length:291 start_codon:yes stop_codon:yes gene_type:complete